MASFDDVLDRATRRLAIDPELRLEVRRELADQLEDSAADFREAGEDAEQAAGLAAKALGDPEALSEQLWRANLTRIRLRYWLKWTGRVALLPVLVLAVAALIVPAMLSSAQLGRLDAGGGTPGVRALRALSEWQQDRLKAQLSEEERLIIYGDEGAETRGAAQRAIYERFPDRPMYYANYVNTLIRDWPIDQKQGVTDPDRFDRLLGVFERGERIEPDNGYYPLLRAALLLESATERIDQEEAASYELPTEGGETETVEPTDYRVTDAERYRRGLEAFVEAVRHPYIRTYAVAMERHRQTLLPGPSRYWSFLLRQTRGIGVLLPWLSRERAVASIVGDHALDVATGDPERAQRMLAGMRRLAGLRTRESQTLIELLVAQAVHQLALSQEAVMWHVLNRPGALAEAMSARRAEVRFFEKLREGSSELRPTVRKRAGTLMTMIVPAVGEYRVDWQLPREAELAMFDQGVLGLGTAGLTLALLVGAAVVGVIMWRRRGTEEAPLLLWIGWRRLAVVLGGGVLLPVAVYALWAWGWPGGSHRYGLNYALGPAVLEWLVLGLAVLVATTHLGLWAIRRRAREVGVAVPPARSRAARWVLAGFSAPVAAATVWCLAAWPHENAAWWGLTALLLVCWTIGWVTWLLMGLKAIPWRWGVVLKGAGLVLALMLLIGLVMWLAVPPLERRVLMPLLMATIGAGVVLFVVARVMVKRGRQPRFVASAARSLVPVYGLAALLLLAVGGPALRTLEAVRVGQLVEKEVFIWSEVERTNYSKLRQRLTAEVPPAEAIGAAERDAG